MWRTLHVPIVHAAVGFSPVVDDDDDAASGSHHVDLVTITRTTSFFPAPATAAGFGRSTHDAVGRRMSRARRARRRNGAYLTVLKEVCAACNTSAAMSCLRRPPRIGSCSREISGKLAAFQRKSAALARRMAAAHPPVVVVGFHLVPSIAHAPRRSRRFAVAFHGTRSRSSQRMHARRIADQCSVAWRRRRQTILWRRYGVDQRWDSYPLTATIAARPAKETRRFTVACDYSKRRWLPSNAGSERIKG
jgi:hypothetical protein